MVQERTLPVVTAPVQITKEEGLRLYEDMVLGALEDKCAEMYQGQMFGFVHLYNGQEAVSLVSFRRCDR